ncbi:uncharacterized protein MKK02DRAFT_21711 [Dioszegia hungarica]|uniref:Galactose oxidase n=1 Tax=Dioszegia hungarica TaxID=4972 RepID=A0AA38HDH4_9TREE|nr:uncharacterized protein MKK02DRAFT_21711 [Dioszegia hungarica]KAI9639047.1 hypothetical protein MKK02DRAFT_21711 [Dioszegia hungarica]
MSGQLAALFALLPLLPLISAWSPAARWGHDAVYVPSQDAMYVVGGQVLSPGVQVTNDVLIYPLNGTNPSWTVGPSVNLPPHAFASVALTPDGKDLVVVGGMTSDCGTDALTHTLDLKGNGSWVHASPEGLVRRRGAGMGVMKDSGKLMLVGGVADQYSCASYTTAFPAVDTLNLPLSTSSVDSTHDLPGNLTGSSLAVSDFAMTTSSDGKKMYLLSGQTSTGALVALDTAGVWTNGAGWASQKLGGNIPVGRVGASLVAHPNLDLLVLHGGARDDRGSDLSTSLLALLNTTSWQWTIPSTLQPPQSSSVSYHSAIMTPTGVMISAFGMSGTGSPRSDMFFLDMRDPSASAWSWKSAWKNDMLQAYVTPSTESTSTGGGSVPVNASMGTSSSRLASIVAPVVILSVIGIPILVFFIRRKMRIAKKRRMARHFSFSSQEDGGDFHSPLNGSGRSQSRTQHYPFGPDSALDEKEDASLLSDFKSNMVGLVGRFRRRSSHDEMRHITAGKGKKGKYNEKSMKWEEIDFGLGEVDSRRGSTPQTGFQPSSRRSSFSATGSPPEARYVDSVPMPGDSMPEPVYPIMNPSTPPHRPVSPSAAPPVDEGLDWNMLQQDLDNRPAFRSISPTSPLRSHQTSHQAPSTPPRINTQFVAGGNPFADRHAQVHFEPQGRRSSSPVSPAPALPYLDFQTQQSPTSAGTGGGGARPSSPSSITSINPKTGRRTSYEVPVTPPRELQMQAQQSPRSVSSPIGHGARQLAGNFDRRGSAPTFYTAPSSPASPTPASASASPATRYEPGTRRGSIPYINQMGSPMIRTGSSGGERRGSQLRVCNVTEEDGQQGQAI